MEAICRICRCTSGSLVDIFLEQQKTDEVNQDLAFIIKDCTGTLVMRGDALPQKICPPCQEWARSAFRFKDMCLKSYKYFCEKLQMQKLSCSTREDVPNVEQDEIIKEEYIIQEQRNLSPSYQYGNIVHNNVLREKPNGTQENKRVDSENADIEVSKCHLNTHTGDLGPTSKKYHLKENMAETPQEELLKNTVAKTNQVKQSSVAETPHEDFQEVYVPKTQVFMALQSQAAGPNGSQAAQVEIQHCESRLRFLYGKCQVCVLCCRRFQSIREVAQHHTDCADPRSKHCTKCNLFRSRDIRSLSSHIAQCGPNKTLVSRVIRRRVELVGSEELANSMDWSAYAARQLATPLFGPTPPIRTRGVALASIQEAFSKEDA